MAKSLSSGQGGLPGIPIFPGKRSLWIDLADSEGGLFDPCEYRGGVGSGLQEGIYPVSEDQPGIAFRTGNPSVSFPGTELLGSEGSRSPVAEDRGSWQDAQRAHHQPRKEVPNP